MWARRGIEGINPAGAMRTSLAILGIVREREREIEGDIEYIKSK